jgi:2-aminobenzoate-CoA ligase
MASLESPSLAPSGHVDTFTRDRLPPPELWPVMRYDLVSGLDYPATLNCAWELLERHARGEGGGRTAFIFPGGRWTYAELFETSSRIARVLTEELGLVTGNRVLLRAPNTPMMAACWFAVLQAGGVCVSTMPLLRSRELAYIIEKAAVTIALVDGRHDAELRHAAGQSSQLRHIITFGGAPDTGTLEALMDGRAAGFRHAATAADDVAIIAFTSGTTGRAKGTMHTHRDILAVCDTFSKHVLRPEPDDVFCGTPPFAFTFGLGGLVLFPMRIGAAALLLEPCTPPEFLKAIRQYDATIAFTAPTAYRAMLEHAEADGVGRLRKCVSAGETLPRATFEAWERATGLRIVDGIGATELLHIFISASGPEIRPGTTGRVVPGYEACVLGDDGQPLPPGEVGRLAVRGPTGCRYLDAEERQRDYVLDGWNVTGDAYLVDDEGYFHYQARTDDMIISSGYNIAGPEVENVLLDHPDVRECGVIGVPDEERGHVVKAVVVLREGAAAGPEKVKELQDFVKAEIAPYKYPRIIEFAGALPRTETGKLQRYRLRE